MEEVPEKISFPDEEKATLEYWDKIDAFKTSVKLSEGRPEYSFYDGPPFATGLPHYGHLLAGTIKDTVTRYAHQTGHHVIRRFGWDCHGLPIEFEIDKQFGVKTREDVLKMGIPRYNAECRAIVMRYSSDWEVVVRRLGRWIDMKNNYKTLDLSFMESVWWVFRQFWDKDLVYRGFKVMPYSTGCTTPLSNFEANMSYKEVSDPAVYVAFPLVGEENVAFVAWTTTPWTLPSNLALCLNPELEYAQVYDKTRKREFIIATELLGGLYKDPKVDVDVKKSYKGKELAGKRYVPLFDYFAKEGTRGAFTILVDNFVTSESGTGIVHCAPAFGEDDYRVCLKANIIGKGEDIPCPVDSNGRFTEQVPEFKGTYVKEADKEIIKHLKTKNRIVQSGAFKHSYPFCWRSDTPLLYKAVPSWFIKVEDIKERLLANNKKTHWVPEFVKEGRFHNWLQDARDWAVSRNRYWGTPLPIWVSEDNTQRICVGSVAELEKLSGVKVNDLHRENIDNITIPDPRGNGGVLRRVDEVFDCWFESGSMPYAQGHYPFENQEYFKKTFPADFIAEGIDQTRGWFYTLMVIGTALFDQAPFKNLIVNGIILASDGQKMSKRLKNYPDPMNVISQYGADSLRLYLISSPVVRAETLKFNEKGVRDVIKDAFLPWFNAYRFFVQNAISYGKKHGGFKYDAALSLSSTNIMDKWILAATQSLIQFVRQEMEAYRLYTGLTKLIKFIDQLTNWYVRLNRRRLKGTYGEHDCHLSLNVLFEVLYALTVTMAPFTPFFSEYLYQNLKKVLPESERQDSVHYLMIPQPRKEAFNERIEKAVASMQTVIILGRAARDQKKLPHKPLLPIKTPLREIMIIHTDPQYLADLESLKSYIKEELNVRDVSLRGDEGSFVALQATPDMKALGKRLKNDMGKVSAAVNVLSHEDLRQFVANGKITVLGHELTTDDIKIVRKFKGDESKLWPAWDESVLTVLNIVVDAELKSEGLAREVVNRIQRLRKKTGLQPTHVVEVFYDTTAGSALETAIQTQQKYIMETTVVAPIPAKYRHIPSAALGHEVSDVDGTKLEIWITNPSFAFDVPTFQNKFGAAAADIMASVTSRDYFKLKAELASRGGIYNAVVNGNKVSLVLGQDFFVSADECNKSRTKK